MPHDLPVFSRIQVPQVVCQLNALLTRNQTVIAECLEPVHPYNWDNLMRALEDCADQLHQFWAPISHLNAVMSSSALRSAYHDSLAILSDYHHTLSHNMAYYQAVCSLDERADDLQLSADQRMVIAHTLRDFKLSGAMLSKVDKKRFAKWDTRLTELCNTFEENVMDSTQAWTLPLKDDQLLSGLPEDMIKSAENHSRKSQSSARWLLALEDPIYVAVMQHADSRWLRETYYRAYITRASDQSENEGQDQKDNGPIMEDILHTRHRLAKLLGFTQYADQSLATKMVGCIDEVEQFLQRLIDASLSRAQEDYAQLAAFAKTTLNLSPLFVWDLAYVSEKLRQKKYDLSQEILRPYFPEYKVREGLFEVIWRLFGVRIEPLPDADVWHPDVTCYVVRNQHGHTISYLYWDLYARRNKRGGAWMDDARVHRLLSNGASQLPIAFVICNFSPPVDEQPALFTHEQVVTLFHECGHALQHMLSDVQYADISGINGVPWDAVEFASQLLEEWAWESEVLNIISEHHRTREPLPDDLRHRMHKARYFQSSLQMMRQLEFALFDLRIHSQPHPCSEKMIQHIAAQVHQEVSVIPNVSYNRFQNSFSHIFSGGYAAGYYSYKWAEVMAIDAFSLFKQNGLFDPDTCQKLQQFLKRGGAENPMDLFIQFRGRKPRIDTLIKAFSIEA